MPACRPPSPISCQQPVPTYVTLTVSEVERDAIPTNPSTRKSAVTSGSGFIVDGNGTVMTAAHVAVQKGNSISARAANRRVYAGKVIGIMPGNDMAIIKLRGYTGKAVSPSAPGCRARATWSIRSAGHPPKATRRASGRLNPCILAGQSPTASLAIADALVLPTGTQKGESGGPRT